MLLCTRFPNLFIPPQPWLLYSLSLSLSCVCVWAHVYVTLCQQSPGLTPLPAYCEECPWTWHYLTPSVVGEMYLEWISGSYGVLFKGFLWGTGEVKRWLSVYCSSGGSHVLFWPPQAPADMWYTCDQHTNKQWKGFGGTIFLAVFVSISTFLATLTLTSVILTYSRWHLAVLCHSLSVMLSTMFPVTHVSPAETSSLYILDINPLLS